MCSQAIKHTHSNAGEGPAHGGWPWSSVPGGPSHCHPAALHTGVRAGVCVLANNWGQHPQQGSLYMELPFNDTGCFQERIKEQQQQRSSWGESKESRNQTRDGAGGRAAAVTEGQTNRGCSQTGRRVARLPVTRKATWVGRHQGACEVLPQG